MSFSPLLRLLLLDGFKRRVDLGLKVMLRPLSVARDASRYPEFGYELGSLLRDNSLGTDMQSRASRTHHTVLEVLRQAALGVPASQSPTIWPWPGWPRPAKTQAPHVSWCQLVGAL